MDLWVPGDNVSSGYRAADTFASLEPGESAKAWTALVSRPSCSGVWATPRGHKLPAEADPMGSGSEHGVAHFMMSNWCLSAIDSAATAPRPPGVASFATVVSRWAIRTNSSRINENFNHRTFLKAREYGSGENKHFAT